MALHYSSRLDCEDTVDCMGNLLPGGLQELSIHAIPLYSMVQRDVSSRILRRTNDNDEILTKLTASSIWSKRTMWMQRSKIHSTILAFVPNGMSVNSFYEVSF